MKTHFYYLLGFVLILLSCEKSEYEVDGFLASSDMQARSASVVSDPLSQLSSMLVHVKNVESGKYLSAYGDGRSVGLNDNDDGSGRQRWYIERGPMLRDYIKLAGGNDEFNGCFIAEENYAPFLQKNNFPGTPALNFVEISNTDYYYIETPNHPGPFPPVQPVDIDAANIFMQPWDKNSYEITFANNKYKGDLTKWQIIPIGEFQILDITYELSTGDNLVVTPKIIQTKTVSNTTDVPVTRTITIQESISSESTFSKTEKMSVSIRQDASIKVGIAEFVDGSFSGGTTSSNEWSYNVGQKEVHSTTVTETITQDVPPRSAIAAKLTATEYRARLTYIAKLSGLGVNAGKIIYLKGKWDGVVVQDTKVELYNPDGRLLKMIKVSR